MDDRRSDHPYRGHHDLVVVTEKISKLSVSEKLAFKSCHDLLDQVEDLLDKDLHTASRKLLLQSLGSLRRARRSLSDLHASIGASRAMLGIFSGAGILLTILAVVQKAHGFAFSGLIILLILAFEWLAYRVVGQLDYVIERCGALVDRMERVCDTRQTDDPIRTMEALIRQADNQAQSGIGTGPRVLTGEDADDTAHSASDERVLTSKDLQERREK